MDGWRYTEETGMTTVDGSSAVEVEWRREAGNDKEISIIEIGGVSVIIVLRVFRAEQR